MLFNRITNNINKKKKILIFGLTFKENCPDLRNSKNLELVKKLISSKYNVTTNDEFVNKEELAKNNILKYSLDFKNLKKKKFDLVLLLVKHNYLIKSKISFFSNLLKKNGIIYDFKNIFSTKEKIVFKQKKLNYIDF